jgi:hypothetical protein
MAKREGRKSEATLRPARPVTAMAVKKVAAKTPAPTAATGTVVGTTVTKMPSSQTAGAAAQGIYLYANDAWAQRYFDDNDLHSVERQLFG